jgi:hypothetical protein
LIESGDMLEIISAFSMSYLLYISMTFSL